MHCPRLFYDSIRPTRGRSPPVRAGCRLFVVRGRTGRSVGRGEHPIDPPRSETLGDDAKDAPLKASRDAGAPPLPQQAESREAIPVRRFLSDTMIYGFVQTFDRAIGFALLAVTTRLMSKSDYGLLSLFSRFTEILFYVVAMGMLTSFFRHYTEAEEEELKRRILNASFWTITAAAVVVAALVAPFARAWSLALFQSADNWRYVLLAVPSTYLAVLLSLGDCRIQADGRAVLFLGVNMLQVVATRGLALVLLFLQWGAMGWIVGSLIGQVASTAVFALLVFGGVSLRWDASLLRKLVPYGLTVMPTALSAWLMYGLTPILMGWILRRQGHADPLGEIALFSVGERVSQIMYMLGLAFVLGWRRFAFNNMHHADGPRLLGNGATVFLAVSGFATVGLIALGDDLLRIMIAPGLRAGVVVVPYLTLAGLFWSVGEVMNIGMHKANRTKLMSGLYILASGVNFVLIAVLIPWFGIVGAAVSLMLGELFKTVLIWRFAQRFYRLTLNHKRLVRVGAVYAAALALCVGLFPETTLASVAAQSAVVAAAPIALWRLGLLAPNETAAVRELISRMTQWRRGG